MDFLSLLENQMYDFQTQLSLGKQIESSLDEFFSRWYEISHVDLSDEINRGIDRMFTNKKNGEIKSIEYKADFKAGSTRNAYVELSVISDSGRTKAGWATHTQADLILYTVIRNNAIEVIYVIEPSVIQENLAVWQKAYRLVKCHNEGYHSSGVLVPLSEIAKVAKKTLEKG
jgi:hypothetical protein